MRDIKSIPLLIQEIFSLSTLDRWPSAKKNLHCGRVLHIPSQSMPSQIALVLMTFCLMFSHNLLSCNFSPLVQPLLSGPAENMFAPSPTWQPFKYWKTPSYHDLVSLLHAKYTQLSQSILIGLKLRKVQSLGTIHLVAILLKLWCPALGRQVGWLHQNVLALLLPYSWMLYFCWWTLKLHSFFSSLLLLRLVDYVWLLIC